MTSSSVILMAVGDISVGDYPFCLGYGVGSVIEKNKNKFILENVKNIFNNADIVFGNLETTLSSDGLNRKKHQTIELRGNPSFVEDLKACNFTILNMANNHALQHGEKAFIETIELLNKNNIKPIGLTGDNDWNSKPLIVEKNNISFGFLGYAFEKDKYFKGALRYSFGKPEHIKHDIKKLKQTVDYVIVSYHWGLEFMDRPSVSNIRLARQTIEWGANVIIGHHPHVLQGIERYKDGLIFYSLGNFIFDMRWDNRFTQSVIVKLIFDKHKSICYEIIPIIINIAYQPEVVSSKIATEIKILLENLSLKIEKELDVDTENNSYKYYLEYEKLKKRNRYRSYRYFLKNLYRSNIMLVGQIIKRTITRRVNGILRKSE